MADKMKYDFYVPVCWQVALDNATITCLSEMAPILKILVKNLCSYFSRVKNDQKCPT